MAMIAVRNVAKSFAEHRVLDGVSLEVANGEVVCIIGPSGSGKSTLLRCINGLESYDEGEVTIDGEPVHRESASIHRIRSEVGMVFQRFNLFPHRTALENVMEGPIFVKGVPRAEARAQATALLAKVGLGQKLDAYPAKLSGGQQQRVAIARALAMQPKAILFDEPTSALGRDRAAPRRSRATGHADAIRAVRKTGHITVYYRVDSSNSLLMGGRGPMQSIRDLFLGGLSHPLRCPALAGASRRTLDTRLEQPPGNDCRSLPSCARTGIRRPYLPRLQRPGRCARDRDGKAIGETGYSRARGPR